VRVGLIGVGNMGGAMARRLLDCGHEVTVRDLLPVREAQAAAAGASVARSPAALAAQVELVIVAVVDAVQTREVLFGPDGAAGAMRPGGTVMLCPTIGPADVEACGAELAERGLACIDAPMSGGPARARDGSMSLMVACDEAVWARWQPLLAQLAQRLFRVGIRLGDGARTKLVNNLLAAINLAGAAEALALAERLGLDAAATLAVIEQSSGQSWIGGDRLRRALAGDTSVLAHMALLAKDSALALSAAEAAGVRPALGTEAAARFDAACRAGWADADDSALLALTRAAWRDA
jgi:3-hydroxyisobutyrate dehydrogenase